MCTAAFRLLLPPAAGGGRAAGAPARRWAARSAATCGDPGLACLFGLAFLLMSAFVTVYNYLGFRLLAPAVRAAARPRRVDLPGLPPRVLGVDGGGAARRPVRQADRAVGRPRVGDRGHRADGAVVAAAVLAGLTLVTVGFFAGHSLASGWVGRRSAMLTGGSPAVASSLYLLCYYAGSSVGGTVGGVVFDRAGWYGVVGYVGLLLACGAGRWAGAAPGACRPSDRNAA